MMDRISDLPEPVLQHILSFLPIKQIVQTSLLSKRWNHIWTTFPVLEFDRTFFESRLSNYFDRNESQEERQSKREELFNFVEQTLLSCLKQMIGLKRFTLHMSFPEPELVSIIDRWIGYVIESNVKELNIDVTVKDGKRYNLPLIVLMNKSLTMLTLCDCNLQSSGSDKIKLLSLKKLNLLGIFAEDKVVQNLLTKCPLIEDLSVKSCLGLKNLQLSGLFELMTMKVENNSGLERIGVEEAVNLQSFIFIGQYKPCEINISLCKNLKILRLSMVGITGRWVRECIDKLTLLETLDLTNCQMLESVIVSSLNLQNLVLCRCELLVEVEVEAPKLSMFKYMGDVISLSLNAPVLNRADIDLSSLVIDNPWFVNQIEFLARFNHAQVVNLRSKTGKSAIIPKDLRETFPSPLCDVKDLKLKILKPLMCPEIEDLVDSLLWIASKPDTIVIESGFKKKTFKLKYGKETEEGGNRSCSRFKCWRNFLKEVRFENIREAREEERLKKFFHEKCKDFAEEDGLSHGV